MFLSLSQIDKFKIFFKKEPKGFKLDSDIIRCSFLKASLLQGGDWFGEQ